MRTVQPLCARKVPPVYLADALESGGYERARIQIISEAINRYHTAKGYFQSAIMICRSPERNNEARKTLTILSMSMLTGFALELYFKAWLLASGHSSPKVRAYNHGMNELYADAKIEGLPSINQLDGLVDALSKGHEDFTYRYINDGDQVNNIIWETAFQVLNNLDDVVDAKVGASALYGLVPGH